MQLKTGDIVSFNDPYKVCVLCGEWVSAIRFNGLDDAVAWANMPCEHEGYLEVCPTWDTGGCQCQKVLGKVGHGEPPSRSAGTAAIPSPARSRAFTPTGVCLECGFLLYQHDRDGKWFRCPTAETIAERARDPRPTPYPPNPDPGGKR